MCEWKYSKSTATESLGEQITDETLTLSANQRVTIQIPTEVVSTWYTTTSGIFVSALVNRENVAIHFQQTTQDFENMLLQLKYLKRGGRERRATTEVCNRENNDDGKCCLFDLEVDFEKLNWKWVILPKKINVRVCRGSCSKNNENKSYLELGHVKITQELYHRNDETDLLATNSSQDETPSRDTKHVLCCHPIEYEYLQLIYLTQSGVVSAANLKSMIATKCSCS
uniref:TGF_BETA_2 domain-containing protein n=1 Tax=Caenorhabditis japonica TaxID=281687 RepID=A0A8R1IKC1_CAEJA